MLGGAVWLVLGLSNVFGYLQAIPGREDVALLVLALLLTAAGWAWGCGREVEPPPSNGRA
jgi:hypothetical protein